MAGATRGEMYKHIFSKIITFELLYKKTRKTAKRTQHNTSSDKDTKGT